jgi:mannose-1-phosphate guanylyltransferase
MFFVVMAGGSGTRFWPASRKESPKQFLNISGGAPMVVETCDRLSPLARDEEMVIVLGREHLHQARGLFRDRKIHLLAEPVGRNTAPCIGLGAIYAQYHGHQGPVAFLPADHFIGNPGAFLEGLKRAGEMARSGAIVTLGIMPTRPETGYGYIRRADAGIEPGKGPAYGVSSFVEKPDLEKARQYLARGDYYWNAGIFVATPEAVLQAFKQYLPELFHGLVRLRGALGKEVFEREVESVYQDLEPVSFDNGVMERIGEPVFVVPCECGWSDVGSWEALYELREGDRDGDKNLSEGESLLVECSRSFVSSRSGRMVACLGLEDCLVVDTPDALLVADLKRSQDVRKVIEGLKKIRKDKLL